MPKPKNNIKTEAGRARLRKRFPTVSEPLYEALPAKHTSLGYRISSDTWLARVYTAAKRYRYKTLGRGLSFPEASKKALEFANQIHSGVKLGATLSSCIETYLKDIASRKDGYHQDHTRNMLENNIIGRSEATVRARKGTDSKALVRERHKIADIAIENLTTGMVSDWHQELQDRGLANDSCNHQLRLLGAAYKNAIRRGDINTRVDLITNVQLFPVKSRGIAEEEVIGLKDRRRLVKAAEKSSFELGVLVKTLMFTGCRQIELRRSLVSDFDFKRGYLLVIDQKGKTAEPRRRRIDTKATHLNPLLKKMSTGLSPSDPLFRMPNGEPWNQAMMQRALRDLFKETGLWPEFKPNDLRHTYISLGISKNTDLFTLAESCGTSVEMMQKSYARLIKDQSRAKLQTLSEGLL